MSISDSGGGQVTTRLTPRERDVVRWSAEGKTVQDTGVILGISPHTVGEHLKNVSRKWGTVNVAHTVAFAIRCGELSLDPQVGLAQGPALPAPVSSSRSVSPNLLPP